MNKLDQLKIDVMRETIKNCKKIILTLADDAILDSRSKKAVNSFVRKLNAIIKEAE